MRVTVVGSFKFDLLKRNKLIDPEVSEEDSRKDDESQKIYFERFTKACKAIGLTLAEEGHRLVVAHSNDTEAAEAPTLEGFKSYPPAIYRYKTCPVHEGDPALKAHLDAVEMSDVVILIGGANATYASGLSALRRRRVIIPVPGFGGSAKDLCEIPEIDDVVRDEIRNLDFLADPDDFANDWEKTLTDSIKTVLNQYPKVLIIHGRGDKGEELKKEIILKSALPEIEIKEKSKKEKNPLYGLAEPQIMNLSGSGAVTVPHVFEELASQVSAAIVIVTADDIGGFARKAGSSETIPANELQLQVRARENVWVEVGWFWGRLGREKIFLWLKDKVEIPSDLQGVARTETEKLEDAWKSIKAFLEGMRSSNPTSFEE